MTEAKTIDMENVTIPLPEWTRDAPPDWWRDVSCDAANLGFHATSDILSSIADLVEEEFAKGKG